MGNDEGGVALMKQNRVAQPRRRRTRTDEYERILNLKFSQRWGTWDCAHRMNHTRRAAFLCFFFPRDAVSHRLADSIEHVSKLPRSGGGSVTQKGQPFYSVTASLEDEIIGKVEAVRRGLHVLKLQRPLPGRKGNVAQANDDCSANVFLLRRLGWAAGAAGQQSDDDERDGFHDARSAA